MKRKNLITLLAFSIIQRLGTILAESGGKKRN